MSNVIIMLFFNLMIGLLLGLTPYYSKKDIPFGITLPKTKQTKEIVTHLKKNYLWINVFLSLLIGVGVIALGLFQKEVDLEKLMLLSVTGLFVQLIVSLGVYLTTYKQLKNYKKGLNIQSPTHTKMAIDLSFRDEKIIFPTGYLVALNLAFVLLVVVVTVTQYQHIPETFVTKWDMNMQPVTVTAKSWQSVLAMPALQLFITFVMAISNQSYLNGKQRIDLQNSEESVARNKKFRKKSSLLNFVISICTQLLMTMLQFSIIFEAISPKVMIGASLIFTIIILALTLWFSLYYGQGGDRLKSVDSSKEVGVSEGNFDIFDDDANWKLGMIYFNPKDPSFWVEKRMGLGMTFNFAKWQSWAFLAGTLMIPIGIAYLMM